MTSGRVTAHSALSHPSYRLSAGVVQWTVFALLSACAVLYAAGLAAPATGLFNDDGIYLVTAKALAEGRGYRIISTPDEMWQTKYPPLYPAALSVVWSLYPRFPQNLLALKLLSFGFLIAWFAVSHRYLRSVLRVPPLAALWIVALIAGTALCLDVGALLMSEGLFGLLAYAALLAASRTESQDRHWWVVAALCTAGAFYTRTAGLMLLPAIAAGMLRSRQLQRALAFMALAGGLSLGWPLWQRAHATLNPSESAHYHAKENYAQSNVLSRNYSPGERFTVIEENLTDLGLIPAKMFRLQAPPAFLIFTLACSAGIWFCILRGAWRCQALVPTLFAAFSLGVILGWAWPPHRFCLPLLPILMGFAYHGMPRIPRIAATAWAALAMVVAMPVMLRRIESNHSAAQFEIAADWGRIAQIHQWIKTHLPPQSIVGSNYDGAMYLYTGHKSARFFAPNNRQFYSMPQPTVDQGLQEMQANMADWNMSYIAETGRDAQDENRYDMFKERLNGAHPRTCPLVLAEGYSVCQVWTSLGTN